MTKLIEVDFIKRVKTAEFTLDIDESSEYEDFGEKELSPKEEMDMLLELFHMEDPEED